MCDIDPEEGVRWWDAVAFYLARKVVTIPYKRPNSLESESIKIQSWRFMSLGLGFVLICLLFALQFGGRIWFAWLLHRHWALVPELYGIAWLDIVFRLERAFGVSLKGSDFETIPPDSRVELSAGQLWEVVAAKLQSAGKSLPLDG